MKKNTIGLIMYSHDKTQSAPYRILEARYEVHRTRCFESRKCVLDAGVFIQAVSKPPVVAPVRSNHLK
jgi:hypothetical protein